MRLKTEIWIKAYVRRCLGEGAACYILASGDPSAGAVYIHVDDLGGGHRLFSPAPAGMQVVEDERRWIELYADQAVSADRAEKYLRDQRQFDPDIWIVELEDRQGRHFLDEQLSSNDG